MKTNPPAHWSMSEDGSFYFNEISEDGTFFTMRIDHQKGTARIEYGAWEITGGRLPGEALCSVDGGGIRSSYPFFLVRKSQFITV